MGTLVTNSSSIAVGNGSSHLVAFLDQSRNAAEQRTSRHTFIEIDVGRCQASIDDIDDLGYDITNFLILLHVLVLTTNRDALMTYIRVDTRKNSIKPDQALRQAAVKSIGNDCGRG